MATIESESVEVIPQDPRPTAKTVNDEVQREVLLDLNPRKQVQASRKRRNTSDEESRVSVVVRNGYERKDVQVPSPVFVTPTAPGSVLAVGATGVVVVGVMTIDDRVVGTTIGVLIEVGIDVVIEVGEGAGVGVGVGEVKIMVGFVDPVARDEVAKRITDDGIVGVARIEEGELEDPTGDGP